jgi:hypothetical protein
VLCDEQEYFNYGAWKCVLLTVNSTRSSFAWVAGLDTFNSYTNIFHDEANLMTTDSEEMYTAGRYYNPVSIANHRSLTLRQKLYCCCSCHSSVDSSSG